MARGEPAPQHLPPAPLPVAHESPATGEGSPLSAPAAVKFTWMLSVANSKISILCEFRPSVPTVNAVEAYIAKLRVPITVAVMGCVVNGPAEARHADIGVTGGRGKGVIFKKGKLYRTVPQEELLPVLLAEIDAIAAEHALPS